MSWTIERLEGDGLGAFADEWDALNRRLLAGHPFADTRFVAPLLRHFGRGKERLLVHRNGGGVDGMLLLERRPRGAWRPFLPSQLQAAPVLLPDRSSIDAIFRALPGLCLSVEFHRQDPRYCVDGLLEPGRRVRVEPHATTMEVALDGTFEAYWNERSKNLVKNVRRYQRRVETEGGGSRFVVLERPGDMREAVTRYGLLESAGWKKAAGTAVHIDNPQGRFYAEVLEQFAATGHGRVYELWLADRLAASRLVISGAGMHIILKTSYDESLSQFAPGRLLLHALLERAFAERSQRAVEFYTDATQDQLAWATASRTISHMVYFRHGWIAAVHDAWRRRQEARQAA